MLKLFRRIKYLLQQSRVDRDLAQEVEFHRAMEAERLERDGLDRATDHSVSVRLMGNVTLAREDARHVSIGHACDRLWQDTRYAFRSLRRNVFFAASPCSRLRLVSRQTRQCSASSTPSSFVRCRTADPDRLVLVWTADPARNIHEGATSYLTLNDWRSSNRRLADLAFWRERAGNITSGGEPERVVGALASANLFSLLGISPVVGRKFTVDEERERETVVVLSHRLWQRRYGGAASAVGQTLEVDGRPLHIIGVMPEGFDFPTKDVQHWEPATLMSAWSTKPAVADRSWGNRQEELWRVIGRLSPGAQVRDAQTRMDAIGKRLTESTRPAIQTSSAIRRRSCRCCSR